MKKLNYIAIILLGVAIVVGVSTAIAKKKAQLSTAKAEVSRPIAVRLVTVEEGSLSDTLSALAVVKSASTIELKSEVAAKILKLMYREGDLVRAGDTIALLDAQEQKAQLQGAIARSKTAESQLAAAKAALTLHESRLNSAETNLEFWIRELARDENLLKEGAISLSAFETTRNKKVAAESELKALKSQISAQAAQINSASAQIIAAKNDEKIWEVRKNYTELKAPVDGVISARLQEEGNMVMPSTPIYSLEDQSKTRLILQVPQEYASQIKIGQKVHPKVAPCCVFQVNRIHPTINSLRQITLEAELVGEPKGLIYDMQMPVTVELSTKTGSIIPNSAKFVNFLNPNNIYVYTVTDKVATRVEVSPHMLGKGGEALVDMAAVPTGAQLAVGAYLENLRLPESFEVEVVK